jgi:hypothetical protein
MPLNEPSDSWNTMNLDKIIAEIEWRLRCEGQQTSECSGHLRWKSTTRRNARALSMDSGLAAEWRLLPI